MYFQECLGQLAHINSINVVMLKGLSLVEYRSVAKKDSDL